MGPELKKQKLNPDSGIPVLNDSLALICDWSKSEATAIKHYEDAQTFIGVTYAELAVAKLRVEQILGGTHASVFVGIAFDIPSYCLPALMLGIMSTGRAFVCLPSSTSHSQKMCDRLRPSHIFSLENTSKLAVTFHCQIHSIKLFFLQLRDHLPDTTVSVPEEQIFAYATTTSGSTGEPKIVRVTHRSILPNVLDLKRILFASEVDTIAQITPLTFDPSIIEIFLSLACGGSLFTASQNLKNDPKTLLETIAQSRVSVLQSTPSLLMHRWSSEDLRRTILSENTYLRILMLGGENFPSPEALTRMKAPGNVTRMFDIYGITEVSCWASIREIFPHDQSRVLGKCMSETIIEARDAEGNTVEEGEGVLHIGSHSRICVIDDEEMVHSNISVFRNTGDVVTIDREGLITLKGRSGRRVKRYGTKVNLSELESHVLQLPFVQNCYALFMENNQSLHLFFTTFDNNSNDTKKLRHETDVFNHAKELSDIYRPDKVHLLNRFELTSNGKICRNFLKKFSAKSSESLCSAKNDEEIKPAEILANIWNRSLPSRGDSGFLDLGGTSVMALRIANELSDESGRDFPELIGRLLKNENFNTCRAYIWSQASDYSKTIAYGTDAEESLICSNSESNIDHDVGCTTQGPTTDSSNYSTKLGITIAWQKCRGRSSFPTEIEAEAQNTWHTVAAIRLKNLYHLKKCIDASPTVFAYAGGKSYVTVGSHSGVICTAELSKKNESDRWDIELPDRIEASILVLNDFKAVVGCYDSYVYCLHLKTGEIFWKFRTGDAVKCTAVPCSNERNIFFGSYDHYAYCVSLENGSEVWKVKFGNGSISATPCVHGELNSVIFAMLDGTCVCLKQNTGQVFWQNKLDYPIFSAPVILKTGIVVFCDVSGELNGFSASTGEKTWSVKINGTVFSHLLLNTDSITRFQSLLFASKNKNVYKFDCSSRRESPILRLTEGCGVPLFSTPWTNGKIIVVVGTDGELKILDFVNGKLLNKFKLGGDVFSSPIIHDDFLVVGCRDNNLYVLTCTDECA